MISPVASTASDSGKAADGGKTYKSERDHDGLIRQTLISIKLN